MWTDKVVIQKIDIDRETVKLYQNFKLKSMWSFDPYLRVEESESNPDIFPFTFEENERFQVGSAGNETRVLRTKEGNLLFSDDYGIPEGFLIGVLFPKGYVPEVFKFKDKPFIPTGVGLGKASIQPPGYFEMHFNYAEKTAAIAFIITSSTFFGFKCIARPCLDDFPKKSKFPFSSDLYATLGFEESHPIQVSANDLESYKQHLSPSADLAHIAKLLNSADLAHIAELLNKLLEANEGQNVDEPTKKGIVQQLRNALTIGASTVPFADSVVALADSYVQGNSVAQVITRLLTYLSL